MTDLYFGIPDHWEIRANMSDASEDAVIPSLNASGQLEFRCLGLPDRDVRPIRLAPGAGNAYLLCLYDIYVACGPNRGSHSGFEAFLKKWKANPLVSAVLLQWRLALAVCCVLLRKICLLLEQSPACL